MIVLAKHPALDGAGYRQPVGAAIGEELTGTLSVGLGLVFHSGKGPLGENIHRRRRELGSPESKDREHQRDRKKSDQINVAHDSGFQLLDRLAAGLFKQGLGVDEVKPGIPGFDHNEKRVVHSPFDLIIF